MGHRNLDAALGIIGGLRATNHRPVKLLMYLAMKTYDLPTAEKPARTWWAGRPELAYTLYLNIDAYVAGDLSKGRRLIRNAQTELGRDLGWLRDRGVLELRPVVVNRTHHDAIVLKLDALSGAMPVPLAVDKSEREAS